MNRRDIEETIRNLKERKQLLEEIERELELEHESLISKLKRIL